MKSPEEKAKELGVPLIPKVTGPWWNKKQPYPHNPIVAICGECGLEVHEVMGLYCPNANCPCGLGPNMCGGTAK